MKTKLKWTMTTLTICLLTGCYTTGLSPREQGANRYSDLVFGFCEQQDQITESGPIRQPMHLGVAQIGETAPPKELVNALKQHPALISDVIELPLSGDPHNRWGYYQNTKENDPEKIQQQAKTLRILGQQLGADYILVIGGNIDSHVESSPLQILDLAILPGMIIPTQNIEMNARAGGAFINAKTGRLEFLLTTVAEAKKSCPTYYIDQELEEMALEQRGILSEQIVSELIDRIVNPR